MSSKITILGIGKSGVNIANEISQYPDYQCLTIDNESNKHKKVKHYKVKKYKSPEDYEQYISDLSLDIFFRNIKEKTYVVVCGASIISGATLAILLKIKDRTKIHILYIKPDVEFLSEIKSLQEKVVYNVLQEYTRSGVFEEIILLSNREIEKSIVDGVSMFEYHQKINEVVVRTFHFINFLNGSSSHINNWSETSMISRISTLGVMEIVGGEEKTFFPLDTVREKCYYYVVPHEVFQTDKTLHLKIKEQLKRKKEQQKGCKISYGIYESDYNESFAFVISRSSEIQR